MDAPRIGANTGAMNISACVIDSTLPISGPSKLSFTSAEPIAIMPPEPNA